jgi:hypothetical protein
MALAGSIFNFPDACSVDQRIGKALFADNGPLTPADRRTFRNEIEEIVCSYVLDENHGIMLTPYSDEEHDYTCLTQVDVFLKKPGKAVRVAELCHRAMPYPLIVVLHDGESLMFSMAEKRFSRDGKEQVVLERAVNTEWMLVTALSDFRNAADFGKNRKLTFKDLYLHYMELLEVLLCAGITGEFREGGLAPEERRNLLCKLHHLNLHLAAIKAKARTETELPRQVELNIQAKRLEREIGEIQKRL